MVLTTWIFSLEKFFLFFNFRKDEIRQFSIYLLMWSKDLIDIKLKRVKDMINIENSSVIQLVYQCVENLIGNICNYKGSNCNFTRGLRCLVFQELRRVSASFRKIPINLMEFLAPKRDARTNGFLFSLFPPFLISSNLTSKQLIYYKHVQNYHEKVS